MESLSVLLKLSRLVLRAVVCQAVEKFVSYYYGVIHTAIITISLKTTNNDGKKIENDDDDVNAVPPSPPLALKVENISTDWLTYILHQKGWLEKDDDATVESFTLEPFGEIGQMSVLYRLKIDVITTTAEGTTTTTLPPLIVKVNEKSIQGRVASFLTHVDEVEVGFFRDLSSSSLVIGDNSASSSNSLLPHPRAVFQDLDVLTGNSLLIMEEITNVETTTPQRGLGESNMSLDQVKVHLKRLAKMHASYWNNPRLMKLHWLKPNSIKRQENWGGMMKLLWNSKGKRRVREANMSPNHLQVLETFVNKSDEYCKNMDKRNYTLCHGDLNPFNLLSLKDSNTTNTTIVVDWQCTLRGNWSQDVAYFFMSNIDATMRRDYEEELLEYYRLELLKHNNNNNNNGCVAVSISQEEFVEDYAYGNVFCLVYFIMSSGVLDLNKPTDATIWNFFVGRITYLLDNDKLNIAKIVASL